MSKCRVNLIFIVFLDVFGAASAFPGRGDSFRREVSLELNPGLKPPSELPAGAALVHVRALGPNDTLHFLLCTSGAPALLLVHCNSTDSELRVDWPRFNSSSPGSLRVVPESSVQYSTALVITRLWEYDDLNNTADPEKTPESNFYPPYDLHSFTWRELNITANESSPVVTVCGGDNTGSFSNGSLCLQFSAYEAEGRDGAWPSLLHHANSSQLRVYLSGIAPRGNDSRFAVELQSISEAGAQGRVSVRSSIDDEYTPSIFKVSEWLWSPLNSSRVSGFTQWKPVAYRKANPVFEDATPCKHSSPEPQEQIPRSALVRGYFREKPEVQALNISFGIAEEPVFYNASRFISWTVLVGVGEPPSDSFSLLIIIIMAVGLCAPLALILVGGVFICIRKRMSLSSAYEPIN